MPDSEDEFALLNEVDILVTKIKARPEIHFDAETDADIRKRIRANESLEVRLTKWQSRLTNLQKLLNAGSSGLSGGPPAASVVATSCAPAVSTGRRKRTCSPLRRPTLCYRKNDDDKPPEMAAIHVEFVEMCAKRLRVHPTATGKELVDEWNEHHAGGWGPSPSAGAKAGRGRSTGRADHFFDNHYVTMQELYGIADGTLPHPVPASTGLVARTRRSSTRILGAKRRRPSRSPSPSPGQDTDANAASPPPEEARRASGRAAAAQGVARRRRAAKPSRSTSPSPPLSGRGTPSEHGRAPGVWTSESWFADYCRRSPDPCSKEALEEDEEDDSTESVQEFQAGDKTIAELDAIIRKHSREAKAALIRRNAATASATNAAAEAEGERQL